MPQALTADNTYGDIPPGYLEDLRDYVYAEQPGKDDIAKKKVDLAGDHPLDDIPTDIDLLMSYPEADIRRLRDYLMTKPVRTGSGVAVVAIMTAPFSCPHGKCTFCPGGPDSFFGDVPQSYTGNEPATMRGIRNEYDAYLQVMNRLEQYVAIGQSPEKVDLIIMGGTFPSNAKAYQEEFVRDALQAMNDFGDLFYYDDKHEENGFKYDEFRDFFEQPGSVDDDERTERIKERLWDLKEERKVSLEEAKKQNETARIRNIGTTIETKPDWGFEEHGNHMLKLGCTRVELGIQTLNDDVLHEVHRGHDLDDSKKSIRVLKDLGFKLNFHMMPGLPGIDREEDIETFDELFSNPTYRPDMMKVYPTMVMPGTALYQKHKIGEYDPLSTEEAADIIAEAMQYVPRYCRVMRVQRDIPIKHSEDGVDKNNLRQIVDRKLEDKPHELNDIKAREIGRETIQGEPELSVTEYDSSDGTDYFVSVDDEADNLLGFVRVRLPSEPRRDEFTDATAIVRELHVYGEAKSIGDDEGNSQHRGFGTQLMYKAEDIAENNDCEELLVISGIGVREYYRKLGYELDEPYMKKQLA